MSRRRIAVVSPFIDKRHGTERSVAEFISRLQGEYEFHIYSSRVEDIELSRVVWHRVPSLPGPQLIAYLWWFLANHLLRWRDQAKGIVFDVIYSPGINSLDADAVSVHIVFARFCEIAKQHLAFWQNPISTWPQLLHRHLYYRMIGLLEHYVYNRADVNLAAVSKKTALDVKKFYPRSPDCVVIYTGIDCNRFSPEKRAALRSASRRALSIGEHDFALLLIGNDWRNKGLNCILHAVNQVRDCRLRVLVVGKDNPVLFSSVIAQLGLQAMVQFCPPRPDVETYYSAADAYVGPSLEDAFAQPVAEAMACGLPVITSRCAGASEIITHGADGLILEDPADSQALAGMLRNLVNDPGLCQRLATAAGETAHRYTWEHHACRMRSFFESAAQRKSRQ